MPSADDTLRTLEPVGDGDCVVEEGDSIASIAYKSGLFSDTIWNDPANAALKEAREDPEVLLPGDRVTVMEIRPKEVTCATGKRHVFRRKGVPVKVTLVLEDEDGEPFADKPYELTVGERTYTGSTDAQGKIDQPVAPDSKEGTLKVWLDEPGYPSPMEYAVHLGKLYPIDDIAGVQQRLRNLGLYEGAADGAAGPETEAAIRAFQKRNGLEETGKMDDATRGKLEEVHGT